MLFLLFHSAVLRELILHIKTAVRVSSDRHFDKSVFFIKLVNYKIIFTFRIDLDKVIFIIILRLDEIILVILKVVFVGLDIIVLVVKLRVDGHKLLRQSGLLRLGGRLCLDFLRRGHSRLCLDFLRCGLCSLGRCLYLGRRRLSGRKIFRC